MYRRQSDADQSRVRDLKLVYDLQLDREISARREYELTVESQLRRELASELRAQAADDIAALRAELTSLRTSLEILFDTDLEHRPALGRWRLTRRPRGRTATGTATARPHRRTGCPAIGHVVRREDSLADSESNTDESAIIDVPEEPLLPPVRGACPVPLRSPARGWLRRCAGASVRARAAPRMRHRRRRPSPSRDSNLATAPQRRRRDLLCRRNRSRSPSGRIGIRSAATGSGSSGRGGQQLGR